jgi:phage terminase large subunit GpA-like protein
VRTRFVRSRPARYWFKPSGKRNEALDHGVYALAALHSRQVPWEVLLRVEPNELLPEGGSLATPPPSFRLPAPVNNFHRRRLRFGMK